MNLSSRLFHDRFLRVLLIGLLLTVVALSALFAYQSLIGTGSSAESSQPRTKRGEPTWLAAQTGSLFPAAAAAESAGELDRVADQVYGQPDYTTGTATVPATDRTVNQPRDIAIYDSGQVFVADTENNRVLGWNCIYNYENGDYADFVLGQPDLTTTTAPDPPTAASMNAPTGVTVGFDGWVYVSDTGNNRVLVFAPTNYEQYFSDEEVYYDPDEYYCEDEWWFPSDFYAPIFNDGQEADYVLGQPDFVSSSVRPTTIETLASPHGTCHGLG